MSRVGLLPVTIPEGVTIDLAGQVLTAKGKQGELNLTFVDDVVPSVEDGNIWVKPANDSLKARKMWGTFRSLASNVVIGVSEGFTKDLQVNGVGYRAQVQGKDLVLQLGHSHEIRHPIPEGIKITCETQNDISIFGADKQAVGATAAKIRSYRPPEPYKGKGVKYKDEQILRKEGKKK
ncbi:MAG: 50S ribosomal protein L6 [Rhodospirillaceae bacterium]|jgi:large subunit ribosomal protein L6|nr:50S ribosomal protein L6 [Rhodospirillaceae bacterium]MBT4587764.1 50S ribosomal protein L6 [Rhodospirillaceae bacterium]MBT5939882.1 50S ribosomal protein L6 [Rhodospirillaceae bacterium]MBT7265481.1 50S ribosomal protein L6 [Rhodospirillaceae bacterium]